MFRFFFCLLFSISCFQPFQSNFTNLCNEHFQWTVFMILYIDKLQKLSRRGTIKGNKMVLIAKIKANISSSTSFQNSVLLNVKEIRYLWWADDSRSRETRLVKEQDSQSSSCRVDLTKNKDDRGFIEWEIFCSYKCFRCPPTLVTLIYAYILSFIYLYIIHTFLILIILCNIHISCNYYISCTLYYRLYIVHKSFLKGMTKGFHIFTFPKCNFPMCIFQRIFTKMHFQKMSNYFCRGHVKFSLEIIPRLCWIFSANFSSLKNIPSINVSCNPEDPSGPLTPSNPLLPDNNWIIIAPRLICDPSIPLAELEMV